MKRIENANHARFLTFSCFRRLPLFSNDLIKDAFVERLTETRRRHALKLHAWVVMPEHVHLILRCEAEVTVAQVLRTLKIGLAKDVISRWRDLDAPIIDRVTDSRGQTRFWQRGGGYDRNLLMGSELFKKIEYVHRNPVRRGLVEQPSAWRWSSARWWSGDRDGVLPCDAL
ncbi:MAG: hypothetical protein CMJ31_08840 [Phycisphaerae bacterium]|nr:hypothetical protein [Phycisphaerae bacterium]|tara:strand:- start:30 stop:542 length:513 start_codon:yes stop_codon:yes gene_type:complete